MRHKIIRNGLVLKDARQEAIRADMLVEDDRIVEIAAPGLNAPEGAVSIDASDRLLIPGLINAHTHSHFTMAKGLAGRWTLELHQNGTPGITGGQTVEDLRLSALLGAAEMIRKGCTGCYDMVVQAPVPTVEGMTSVASAYEEIGIRAVVAITMADQTFWRAIPGLLDALEPQQRALVETMTTAEGDASLTACRSVLDAWSYDTQRVGVAVAPTIPLHCSDAFLRNAAQLARERGVGLHTHIGESKVQAVAAEIRYGKSMVAHLADLGYLGPNLTAAHAVWLGGDDLKRLADCGASIAHNPGSNLRLGNGVAPAHEMLATGVNVGIGTDTCTCSDQLNMFEATRLACHCSRARTPDYRRWLDPAETFTMATTGSAHALGLKNVGRLEVGWKADIVFLDLRHWHYVPLNDPLTQVVFGENGAAVDSVMIGGRMVLRDGRLTTIDEAKLAALVEAANARLRNINAERRVAFSALDDAVGRFCVGLAQRPHPEQRYIEHFPIG